MVHRALDPAYRRIEVEEFLDLDLRGAKAELEDGLVYMMTGGNAAHSRVATNLLIALGSRLRGSGCRPYNSNFGVRTGERSVRFPDISIHCNNPGVPENDARQLIGDPQVVIEVLSPSTSSLDQTVKLGEYLALPGVAEIVFVDPARQRVRHVRRGTDFWLESGAELVLASVDVAVPYDEIFARD